MAQVMVVDDEMGIRELLSEILSDEGHQVVLADSAGAARRLRDRQRPDLVLLDIWMPDTDGITLLKEWSASGLLTMPVVMMSGHGTIETAIEATRIGALDFLEKPIALQRLLAAVRRALRNDGAVAPAPLALASFGSSPALADVKRRLAQLANFGAPLLLRGEPGMEAALFARLVAVRGMPFVEGADLALEPNLELVARAAGGVLYLGELSRFGRGEQKTLGFALARAERYRVRIVSFSTLHPRTLAEQCDFDPELAARLAELTLKLPPLREFADDVPDLATAVLVRLVESHACPARRLADSALSALRGYPWPGNLAELLGVVRDLALTSLGEQITAQDVDRVLAGRAAPDAERRVALDRPYREARLAFERTYFENLLTRENGSVSRVADKAGLERTHLYRKLRSLGLPVGRREEET